MVDLLEGLQTGEQTRESAALERTLRELLGTSSEQLGQCIGILHRIFSLMQKRLSQRVLEISTMSRSTTKGAPGTKGLSGPVNDSDWKIQGKNLAPWLTWLETDQEFGGTLAMRLDANQIVHEDYHRGLVHTFIHELSHAAASTSDFAYLHERDEYGKLTDLHRLANADTIALIAQELTKPPAPSVSKDPGENQNQPKLSQQDVKRLIIAAAGKYKDDNALQVKIYELLDAAGYEWSDFAQEPEFDPDTPLGGRLMFVMM